MTKTKNLVKKYQTHEGDTGSTQVQITLLTERIVELTDHLKEHKKDYDSRSGLLKLVGRRRRLLNYLAATDKEIYDNLVKDLGLRK
jgi:small subunit ribosomal protein S15